MPIYKDEKYNTWYCKFYYVDYNGQKKQKLKRGFKTKREAKAFENDFLSQHTQDITIPLSAFCNLYLEDLKNHVKENTYAYKEHIIRNHIVNSIGDKRLCDITPLIIRNWQNEILEKINPRTRTTYTQTYIQKINLVLSSVFTFACRYYGLSKKPCHVVGSIGSKKTESEMKIWTLQEFNQFIEHETNKIFYTAFSTLFYTGLRVGELLALTWDDLDFANNVINVNKTYARVGKSFITTTPKTNKSVRSVVLFPTLTNILESYKSSVLTPYGANRVFGGINQDHLRYELNKICTVSGIKQIRLHDLRHSHVSMLIEMDFNPLIISDRLGHEDITTTLNIYSHLYPNKQNELSKNIEEYIHKNHEK